MSTQLLCYRRLVSSALCSVLLLLCLSVNAEAASPQVAVSSDELVIPEIEVTARRVSENLQTTGVSITAFSAADLNELNVVNASDLEKFTPNLQLQANQGSASQGLVVKIRGIGVSDVDFLNADPSVAIYVDGVFQARAFGPQFELFDVDRVEVLRGPQGTLYGKNALGGAINIITHQPDGEDKAAVDATVGNYGALDFSSHANMGLIKDTLFASVAFISREHDGYYQNLYVPGENLGNENLQAVRGALRWVPSSDLTVTLESDYTRQRQNAQPVVPLVIAPTGLVATAVTAAHLNPASYPVGTNPSWDAIQNVNLDNGSNGGSFLSPGYGARGRSIDDATFKGTALTVSYDISPTLSLRSISSYREFDRGLTWDLDGTPASALDEVKTDDGWNVTQEFQLNASLIDHRLDLTAGVFVLDEKLHEHESNGYLTGLAETVTSLQKLSTNNLHEYDNRSIAGYFHGIWHFTDATRLVAGIRYSEERKTGDFKVGLAVTPDVYSTLDAQQTIKFNATTPTIGLEHELTKSIFGYATVSKGYSSGGFNENPSALTGGISTYAPETLWNYEIGAKFMLNQKLRLNLAGFLMNYDNIVIQTFGVSPSNGGIALTTTNAGKARVTGFEGDMEWLVGAGLKVRAGVGYLDQKFLEYGIGSNGEQIDPSSAHFFDSPATTANAVLEYTLPIPAAAGIYSISGDSSYRGRTYFDNNNLPVSSQAAYNLFGARATFTSPNGKASVTGFVSNLADKAYIVRSIDVVNTAFGYAGALFGPPRTYGVRFAYKIE